MKVAFIVGEFPAVSETFIINQVADLKDRGIEVEVFSFEEDRFISFLISLDLRNIVKVNSFQLCRAVAF